MKKIVMVDGNNLLFRSYYATAYTGNLMKNSKGFPTNGLYGFVNMINKIIAEEKPEYMLVAFDIGRTFRHDMYENYKEGRIETPDDLKQQFPIAKEIITNMGISCYEIDNYEADDIIGTVSKFCDKHEDVKGTIISSDRDLLQLISEEVEMKLLKQKDFIRYDKKAFENEYEIDPKNVVDLKALQGDSSDNIPGVKGIGEKTALKLIQEYKTLDNLYDHIDEVKGKMKDKLVDDKENAYLSYDLAKINTEVPITIELDCIKVKEENETELRNLFQELEFFSMLKNKKQEVKKTKEIKSINEVKITKEYAFFLELDNTNYHQANIIGMSVYNDEDAFYMEKELIKEFLEKFNFEKYTYDLKRSFVALKKEAIALENTVFDTMIAAYLLDLNIKDDISYLANQQAYSVIEKPSEELFIQNSILKSKFIFETKDVYKDDLEKNNMTDLYYNVDFKLTEVLGDMEYSGVCIKKEVLDEMGEEIKIKIDLLSEEIYSLAGEEFNISSPKQLANILFEKLNLQHGKKTKTGFSTNVDVLEKLVDEHAIISKILEYRILTKLYSTYIEGLKSSIEDEKIHTIYNQTLARTGRLSSVEPNLQNIPIRYEYGRLIRKAFVASENSVLLSADYSQIELRILAHISEVPSLIEAFQNNDDIHTKTAQDIFDVDVVNSEMRRIAKAVNFGIIYGISEYGLSNNLNISFEEAKRFINNYLEEYPGVKKYMDDTISESLEKGYVTTLFNRKRIIPELGNKNYMIRKQGERMALNTPIQGTSADILKMAMIKIDEEFREKNIKSKMILQVHDELVFDVLEEELMIVKKIVKDCMENITELKVPLKVDIATSCDWYSAK